jgi:cell division septum initiation protein DivIVA
MSRFGRRGVDEEEVQGYLAQVAEEIAARDREIGRLSDENRQLKHALREWHREIVGYDAADLVARAQMQVEAQIANAERYSREREEEAARQYDAILADARQQAAAADVDPQWLGRHRAHTTAILKSLDALAAQLDATRTAFTHEVDALEPPPPEAE